MLAALLVAGCGGGEAATMCQGPEGPVPVCSWTAAPPTLTVVTAVDPYPANPASCTASVPAVVGQKIPLGAQQPSGWSTVNDDTTEANGMCQEATLFSVYLADAGCRWTITAQVTWPAVCFTP